MATLNVGIKINAAVSSSGSSGTIYTAPANSYALVDIFWNAGGANTSSLTVGGQQIVTGPTNGTAGQIVSLIVGPGQTVVATPVTGTGNTYRMVGVNLINTI